MPAKMCLARNKLRLFLSPGICYSSVPRNTTMSVIEFSGATTDLGDDELMPLSDDEPVTALAGDSVNPMRSGQLNDSVS